MMRIRLLLCLLLLGSITPTSWAMTIRLPAPEGANDSRYPYFVQQLRLALDHTQLKGQYQLTTYPREVTQSRVFALINAAKSIWSGA